MTFDDDFVQVEFEHATRRFRIKAMGLTWPPPETIEYGGFVFRRDSFSQVTDDQRAQMTAIMRGARYIPETNPLPTGGATTEEQHP